MNLQLTDAPPAIAHPSRDTPVGAAFSNDSPVLRAAVGLAETIDAVSLALEQERRLSSSIALAMKEASSFGMTMPHKWGGAELGSIDASADHRSPSDGQRVSGLGAMINCVSGYTTAFLDLDVGRAINLATGASATPSGTVVRANGGYCVSGRFRFVSGVDHCDWMFMGCIVVEDGALRLDENGVPETPQCFLRQAEVSILDTWHSSGRRCTGSHHIFIDNAFVMPTGRDVRLHPSPVVSGSNGH